MPDLVVQDPRFLDPQYMAWTPGVRNGADIVDDPADPRGLSAPGYGLSQIPDTVFFSLGPVYEIVRITTDLVAQYAAECGLARPRDTSVRSYQFDGPILGGLERWGRYLQAIPTPEFREFYAWMLTAEFHRGDPPEWWKIGAQGLEIPDPGLRIADPTKRLRLAVFLPQGEKRRAVIEWSGLPMIKVRDEA